MSYGTSAIARLWFAIALGVASIPMPMPATPVSNASASTIPPEAQILLDQAHQLARAGNDAAAVSIYAGLVGPFGDAVSAQALYQESLAALHGGDTATAAAALGQLPGVSPAPPLALQALLVQEQVGRQAGDCPGALDALDTFAKRSPGDPLMVYVNLERATCFASLGDWTNDLNAAKAALAAAPAGPRLAQINADEMAAAAELQLNDQQDALMYDNQALALAGTRAYRAEMLYTTAGLMRSLGQTDAAAERYRGLVVDFPEQPRAFGALTALADMRRQTIISPYQAGLVHLNAADYQGAIDQFDQVPADSTDAGVARFNRAVAILRLGREGEAVQELEATAAAYPAQAGEALSRAGRVLESNGDYAGADAVYGQLLQTVPTSAFAGEATFRSGLTRYLRNDLPGALAAWQRALDPALKAPDALQAQVLFWTGKVLATQQGNPDAPDARAAWTRAATLAPDSYDGLRAQDLLVGYADPSTTTVSTRDSSRLTSTASDDAELRAWLLANGRTPEKIASDLAADPSLARADSLLAVGLRAQAGWEVETVSLRYTRAKDLGHLQALGDWLLQRDLADSALTVGTHIRDIAGGHVSTLPRAVQRVIYPAGWGDIAFEQAALQQVDPLLLMALVRQESSFNPTARSGAQAMGLTQVIPATARDIAARLGLASTFSLTDLYKPAVSLQFGAWYLNAELGRYGGAILPSLAAYNGGGGNVDGWLRTWGNDPDVFVEQIPFAETQRYVKVVYENYQHYQRLYG